MKHAWMVGLVLALVGGPRASAIENANGSTPNGKIAYLRQPDGRGGYRFCTAPLLAPNCALVPLRCLSSQEEGHTNEVADLQFWLPNGNQVDGKGEPIPTTIVGASGFASAPLDYDGLAVVGLKANLSSSAFSLPSSALATPEPIPSTPSAKAPKHTYSIQALGRKAAGGNYGVSNASWFSFLALPLTGAESSGLTLFAKYKAPPKAVDSMSESELLAHYNSLSWALTGDEGGAVVQGNTLVGLVSSSLRPDAWMKGVRLGKADTAAPYNGVIPVYPHVSKIKSLMTKVCPPVSKR
jgi:hypothetical protein